MGMTKKQKEVFEYIKGHILTHGISPTQKEIMNHFQLKSLGSVQRYVKYLIQSGHLMNQEHAHRGLQINPHLHAGAGHSTLEHLDTNPFRLPLLGKVAAGIPIEAIESCDQKIEVPPFMVQSKEPHFVLEVQGESMIEEGICPTDLIVCRQQKWANSGDIVVAMWDGEVTVKFYYKHQNKGIELRPANQLMESFWPRSESFELLAKVVGLIRSYNN